MTTSWTMVTGASGFIGSTLVKKLIERGEPVRAFVRAGSSLAPFEGLPRDRFELAYGEITVAHTLYRGLAGCDRIYHLAAPFRYWSRRPREVMDPTVQGTRAVLEAARRRGLSRVVLTNSAGALGVTTSDEPMDETHSFNLMDPEIYLRAKVEAMEVAEQAASEGLSVVVVMPSAVFGPGDWKPTPNGHALLEYLKISPGGRVPATDGGISVVDVEDVAEGHILAMDRGRVGERYILGGENLTFRHAINLLHDLTGLAEPGERSPGAGTMALVGRALELYARMTGRDPMLTHRLARDHAFSRVWVSSAKAERELGYTHRPARETLARAIRWYVAKGYLPRRAARRVRLELRPV